MVMNIIMLCTLYPVGLILFFVFRHYGNREGKYVFGVTLDSYKKQSEEVKEIKKQYKKEYLILLLLTLWIPLAAFFVRHVSIQYAIWMLWFIAEIVLMFVPFARANKRALEFKNASAEDGDRYWKWGIFYSNKKDKSIIVDIRFGVGQSVNMATAVGKATAAFVIICLAMIPLSCGWLLADEFAPMKLIYENDQIVCHHLKDSYIIPEREIISVELVEALPENRKRNAGSSTDFMEKGTFNNRELGKFKEFVTLNNNVYIKIIANDNLYFINDADKENTLLIYDCISK